ncbi:MAG: NAD(P)/FAD-dependent oxidoreductase [Actinobacteria bacterium]|nr:NAD(P)/FAD-dependent oxidoreductase [Actinomycetota bacterium]
MRNGDGPRTRVTVVGASVAGLHAAGLLARGGCEVRILERRSRLDHDSRTLIVTSRMRDLLGPLGDTCIRNRIERFELHADGITAEVPLAQPDLVIERSALIRDLAEEARQRGAELCLGMGFAGVERDVNSLRLSVENADGEERNHIETDVLVGADGAFSRVAQAAGWPRQPTVPLLQAIVELPPGYDPATCGVWFRPQDTAYFYWLIPESQQRGAVGVIGEDGPHLRRRLDAFLENEGFAPLSYQAGRAPLHVRWIRHHRRLGRGSVYLVGDAAAQVKVSTVGGVVTGLRGARAVAAAITNGDGRREALALRRELLLHRHIRGLLHRFSETDYRDLIALLDDGTRRLLGVHSRDEATKVVGSLLRARPALALFALRAVLGVRRPRAGIRS